MPANPSDTPDEYRKTYLDRTGPDGALLLRAMGYGASGFLGLLLLFALLAKKTGFSPLVALPLALAGTAMIVVCGLGVARLIGAGFSVFIAPSGNSTPSEPDFSYQQALAARGDVPDALESYEALIAEMPLGAVGGIDVRIRAAELYAREGGNPRRAAQLLREVQRGTETPANQDVYVSYRLMDLLAGPLGEPGRVLVELRRLVERYPETDVGARARAALAGLKRELGEESNA